GVAALADAIERLPVVGSVLLTGAHPDDENNALLTYLARGLHLRTAYLSATRGDGGQNLLGNEQYEALGILRTEELMAARRIDGAEQYFANAYDFGFSKDAGETLEKWGHENVLRDYVRVIRRFRPDIIISRFTGTPADGHGHHQASGILTKEAFRAAGDPTKFPELEHEGLKPWQAKWLFINRGGRGGQAGADSFTITLGGYSPIYGEEYGDLGAEARSQHRSQGMGQMPSGGPYTATFTFADSAIPSIAPPKQLFEGVSLTLSRFQSLAGGGEVSRIVGEIEGAIDEARQILTPTAPEKMLDALLRGHDALGRLPGAIRASEASPDAAELALFLAEQKKREFERAILLAAGARLSAVAETGEAVPGGSLAVTVSAEVPARLRIGEIRLEGPSGWKIEPEPSPAASGSAGRVTAKFRVSIPAEAAPSQPYWLRSQRSRDYFQVDSPALSGLPFQPSLLKAHILMASSYASAAGGGSGMEGIGVAELRTSIDVVHRYEDRIYGEREEPVAVLPQLGVWLEPPVAVFPAGQRAVRTFSVRVRNNTAAQQSGTVRLLLQPGWRSTPPSVPFALAKKGDEVSLRFEVAPPSGARFGDHVIKAVAEVNGESHNTGYTVIDYPHIQKRYWFQPAVAKLEQVNVKVASGLRVGYIMGSGDEVPGALKQLGVAVTELTTDDLAYGDLSRFNVIITGIRAYEVRKDISANHARLMEWVRNGGLMIAQYSRPGGFSDILSPYPMKMNTGLRVAVEEAPVEILEPSHPFFHFPNEITPEDFNGWVQERGTYFMESWAPEYTPLLASNDPGEPPQKGGMLVAKYGNGYYVYTGYTWFRQLPAGVPGAYRLFANLISLGKAGR
ncbi:MAG TPA: PIG-L family deacetylase, partial [Terriglobia bacterium]|nr:PIG-L family deacetylase [Terriglobia bacterium]